MYTCSSYPSLPHWLFSFHSESQGNKKVPKWLLRKHLLIELLASAEDFTDCRTKHQLALKRSEILRLNIWRPVMVGEVWKDYKTSSDLNNHYNTWPKWLWRQRPQNQDFSGSIYLGWLNPQVLKDLVIKKLEIGTAIGRHSDAEQMYIWKWYDVYDDDNDARTFWVVVSSSVCLCQVNQLCIVCKISWRRGKTGTNYWEMFFVIHMSIHHCTVKKKKSYLQIYRYHSLLHLLYIFILWT